jgi:hypothetical protein
VQTDERGDITTYAVGEGVPIATQLVLNRDTLIMIAQ